MRKIYFVFVAMGMANWISTDVQAQSTGAQVYQIFQANCNSSGCHNATDLAGGLDLEGSGATLNDRMVSVYNALFDVAPSNTYSANKGYKRIYPGDPYRSTLFRRVHNSIDQSVNLDGQEGATKTGLADTEIELIRQWIIFGSPTSGYVVDSNRLADFYGGNGIYSITTIPPAPPAGQGFQVHLGPFFMAPNTEQEFFYKYRTETPAGVEVTTIEPIFGPWSHHFILNQFDAGQGNGYGWGLRDASSHFDARLMGVFQFADSLTLPEGTAFDWPVDAEIDMNTHFINYSFTEILAADVYLNVYTQPKGTAAQIMNAEMIPNFAIYIFNNGQDYTFELPWFTPFTSDIRYIWSVTSHTHKYGKAFQIFTRNSDGSKDDLIYDADYMGGDPTGVPVGYDYQHPPQRFFDPFLVVPAEKGLIQRATYNNNGPSSVGWGNTSQDEMMLLIVYYVDDTAGVIMANDGPQSQPEPSMLAYPNPAQNQLNLQLESPLQGKFTFSLMDAQGKLVKQMELDPAQGRARKLDVSDLDRGIYFYQVTSQNGYNRTGKVVLQ